MLLRKIIFTGSICLIMGSGLYSYADQSTVIRQPYKLVWSDEFNREGPPDRENWEFGEGFQRNHELQWYQKENGYCQNGHLIIEARKAHFKNPGYDSASSDWRKSRKWVAYTSAILTTAGKRSLAIWPI